ncbi:hydroxypyruvate isomerase family protein [Burkholderia sp. 3C]
MKLSAHLGFQFNEVPFLGRFAAAAQAGYRYVEFPAPYDYDIAVLRELLARNQLEVVQICTPMGSGLKEKGLAALSERCREFREGVDIAREAALALNSPRVHVMAGVVTNETDANWRTYVENVRIAVQTFGAVGLKTLVEVMSPAEVPGYYMSSYELAASLFELVDDPRLELLFDTYHAASITGDTVTTLKAWLPRIGHIQISDFPGRHEPGSGSLPFDEILSVLEESDYRNWLGCEYRPKADTVAGLRSLPPNLRSKL